MFNYSSSSNGNSYEEDAQEKKKTQNRRQDMWTKSKQMKYNCEGEEEEKWYIYINLCRYIDKCMGNNEKW